MSPSCEEDCLSTETNGRLQVPRANAQAVLSEQATYLASPRLQKARSTRPGAYSSIELSLIGFGAAKWQAQKWPGSTSRNSGRSLEHFSQAMGQRVWKQQPDGASIGEGGSPARMMRLRVAWMSGSGTGTAESSDWV